MKLWIAHLKSLRGFYASDAYVVANTRDEALVRLMQGVEAYVGKCEEDGAWMPCISASPFDEEFKAEVAIFLENVVLEAQEALTEVPENVIIDVRI